METTTISSGVDLNDTLFGFRSGEQRVGSGGSTLVIALRCACSWGDFLRIDLVLTGGLKRQGWVEDSTTICSVHRGKEVAICVNLHVLLYVFSVVGVRSASTVPSTLLAFDDSGGRVRLFVCRNNLGLLVFALSAATSFVPASSRALGTSSVKVGCRMTMMFNSMVTL